MPTRCPSTDTITVNDEPLELQCVEWSEDPEGRHRGDHHVPLSPAMGGERTWANENPLSEDEAA